MENPFQGLVLLQMFLPLQGLFIFLDVSTFVGSFTCADVSTFAGSFHIPGCVYLCSAHIQVFQGGLPLEI